MMMKSALLLALLPAAFVGGCAGTQNRGLESVHQPVVSRTDLSFDVGAGPRGLAPGEAERLSGWMASLRLGYGDQVTIDDPASSLAVRADISREVERFGLLLMAGAPVTGAPIAPGTARVVITRTRARVPGCPDFSRVRQPEFESNTSSNQGCSINSNLAAMIANPLDLVQGASSTSISVGAAGVRAINGYRTATPSSGGSAAAASTSSASPGGK